MRATEGNRRPGAWRRVVVLASAAVLIASINGVTGVAGTNQRFAYVGSPPAPTLPPDPAAVGTLTFTSVTAGGQTKVDYIVHSYDNQNLTHAFLDLESTTFPQALGLTVATVYGPDGAPAPEGPCTWTVGGKTVRCDFQKLTPKNPDRAITVVWNVDATFDTAQTPVFTASLQVNEQTNPNGTNVQVYQANSGGALVLPANPNLISTFVPPGQAKKIATQAASGSNIQSTDITLPAQSNAIGYTVTVDESDSSVDCVALVKTPCVGQMSEANVNGESASTISPYLEWTITLLTTSYKCNKAPCNGHGVIHFVYDSSGNIIGNEIIPLDRQHKCNTASSNLPCWSSFSYDGSTLVVTFRTAHNSGGRMF